MTSKYLAIACVLLGFGSGLCLGYAWGVIGRAAPTIVTIVDHAEPE